MKSITASLSALLVIILSSGCATNDTDSTQEKQVAESSSERVCRYERPTGSNIKKRRCWSKKDYDKMVKESEAEMQRVSNSRSIGGTTE